MSSNWDTICKLEVSVRNRPVPGAGVDVSNSAARAWMRLGPDPELVYLSSLDLWVLAPKGSVGLERCDV